MTKTFKEGNTTKTFTEIKDLVGKDNECDNYIIVAQYPEIEYTLIYRNSRFEPWVAAWCYHDDKGYWSQGHYFAGLNDAVRYIDSVLEEHMKRESK